MTLSSTSLLIPLEFFFETETNFFINNKNSMYNRIIQRAKYWRELLIPLEIPNSVWNDISMDFLKGLPKANGFEVILVMVDQFSKYGHFLALKHPYTAKTVADLFVKEVVRLHGYPHSIVSDRESFLEQLLEKIIQIGSTRLNRTSAYHPDRIPLPFLSFKECCSPNSSYPASLLNFLL